MKVDTAVESPLDGALFVPRPIIGWRFFWANSWGELESLVHNCGPYHPGLWYEAECRAAEGFRLEHDGVPEPDCWCGFYAYRDRKELFRQSFRVREIVTSDCWAAKVQLAGRVIIHEQGYRAQHMKIIAAWPLERWQRWVVNLLRRRGVGWREWIGRGD